ncbi:MFS transporter [Aureimonas ureilytica]|uniref:MFS transporter n=1 Tax=Aureimonas ureilytica TaxID=401562 RepID=UPI000361216A|nr:MFS transporter [Aureimonas ureilytica]
MPLPAPSARNPWIALLCGAVIVTIAMGLRQGFGLLLRPVELEIGVGREAFGLAIAVQNLVLGLAQPFVGALADRHGAGRVAAAGGLLYALGLVLASVSTSALGLDLSLGFLVGLAMTGVTFVVVLGAVGRFVPAEKRGMAFGIVTAGGSVGQFLLVPATQMAVDAVGWRGALLVGAALVSLTVFLALGISGKPQDAAPASAGAGRPGGESLGAALRLAARHPGYWLLNVGFFVCGFHVAFIATHLPAFLADQAIDPSVGARALALIGLFNILGSYVFGLSADRLRKKYVLAGVYFGRAVVIVAFLAVPFTPLSATLFACAMGFLWLGTVPLTSGLVGQIFGVRYLSTLFGIVFMSHQIGAFFGAWGAGLVFARTGSYDAAWTISIALALIAGLANLPIRDARIGALPAAGAAA